MIEWPLLPGLSPDPRVAPLTVGRLLHDGRRHFLPASSRELERARDAAMSVLAGFHFRTGNTVLIVSMLDEVVQYMPIERAAMEYGLVVCSLDANRSDAVRAEATMRRFKPDAVFGVDAAFLDAMIEHGHDPDLIFRDTVIWCRPCAYGRLNVGRKRLILELGPALALGGYCGEGVHVDRFEWAISEEDGMVVLNSRLPRVLDVTDFQTGVRGRVIRGVCECGSPDPRVFPEVQKPVPMGLSN